MVLPTILFTWLLLEKFKWASSRVFRQFYVFTTEKLSIEFLKVTWIVAFNQQTSITDIKLFPAQIRQLNMKRNARLIKNRSYTQAFIILSGHCFCITDTIPCNGSIIQRLWYFIFPNQTTFIESRFLQIYILSTSKQTLHSLFFVSAFQLERDD